MKPSQKYGESGNAVWIILIAVALLATLTITITRSSDSTEQSGSIEQLRIQATSIMRYTNTIAQAADRMVMRGISESDLCFHDAGWGHADYNGADCGDNENVIFHVEGGGLTYKAFDNVTSWDIFGSHAVQDVETANNDLIIQAQVSKKLCKEFNKLLGITNPASDAPVDDASPATRYQGSFTDAAADNIIGNNAAGLAGQKSGCRKDAAGNYWFYHILIAR